MKKEGNRSISYLGPFLCIYSHRTRLKQNGKRVLVYGVSKNLWNHKTIEKRREKSIISLLDNTLN